MKNVKGFTLIELLVVIAIIGVLSSVVLASLSTARVKSRDARRISDLSQIKIALELYYDGSGSYPIVDPASFNPSAILTPILVPEYIKVVPDDPIPERNYLYGGSSNRYILATGIEDTTNKALLSDADAVGFEINGTSELCNNYAEIPQGEPGATEACYDITN